MSKKYKVKEKGKEFYFEKKNGFIDYCQTRYNDWLSGPKNTNGNSLGFKNIDTYFSYDGGETWIYIEEFKKFRQIIQNEKNTQLQDEVISDNKPKTTSWFTYLIYLFLIWLGLTYFNVKKDKISFVNEFNGRVFGWNSKFVREGSLDEILNQNDNEQQTIIQEEQPENNSTNNLNEEQRLNDLNSESESNDNSSNTYQEPEIQQQQQQQQPCFGCKGTGECRSCSKTFRVHYWDDRSNGWKDRNESRRGYVMCDDCDGSGVKYKRSSDFGKWEVERKCYVSSCQDGWVFCRECNNGGSGRDIGKCKECRGTGYRN